MFSHHLFRPNEEKKVIHAAKKKVSAFKSLTLQRVVTMIDVLREASLQAQRDWLEKILTELNKIDSSSSTVSNNSAWFKSGMDELTKLYQKFEGHEIKYNIKLLFRYIPPYEKISDEDELAVKTMFKFMLSSRLNMIKKRLSLPSAVNENPLNEDELLKLYREKNHKNESAKKSACSMNIYIPKYLLLMTLIMSGMFLEANYDPDETRLSATIPVFAISLITLGVFSILSIFNANHENYAASSFDWQINKENASPDIDSSRISSPQ
jgi:hypothetical protein